MKIIIYISIIFLLFSLSSCLEDNVLESEDLINLDASSQILQFLEANDDYINSSENPALIDAVDLFLNLDKYYLIDIRNETDFKLGHIKNSHNIAASNLIEEVEKAASYPKIIIISSTGQHSSYCTAILRFIGNKNIYSLNYGMASWNKEFADPWLSSLKDQTDPCFTTKGLNFTETSPLPNINYDEEEPLSSFIKQRANALLAKKFIDSKSELVDLEICSSFDIFNALSYIILSSYIDQITGAVIPTDKKLNNYSYLICYGVRGLFYTSHPAEAAFILKEENGRSYLQSNMNLQNLPSNKIIYVYSIDGQESAGVAAYLNMLGFNARTILFGAHNIQYSDLLANSNSNFKIFNSESMYNFPYESN